LYFFSHFFAHASDTIISFFDPSALFDRERSGSVASRGRFDAKSGGYGTRRTKGFIRGHKKRRKTIRSVRQRRDGPRQQLSRTNE